jgi:hypothetical protein
MTIFDEIRNACAEVCAESEYVRLKREAVTGYALSLPLELLVKDSLDPESHYFGDPEVTLAYIVTLDTINFGSGYFPHLNKEANQSGYFTISTRLKRYFEKKGPPSAEQLRAITVRECAEILGQQGGDSDALELMGLFAESLNQLGDYLHTNFKGSFSLLVEKAGHSADTLVSILREMPFYADVREYKGLQVPFFKRAQIMASDLHMAFRGQGWGYFIDLASLTCFADNLVPHVLRMDGLLEYDPELLARINHSEFIPAGSTEEIEIRAYAVQCIDLITAAVNARGARVQPRQVDHLLWNRGQGKKYKSTPRHRTRTTGY